MIKSKSLIGRTPWRAADENSYFARGADAAIRKQDFGFPLLRSGAREFGLNVRQLKWVM
jgi:hypothetical protein